MWKRIQNFFDPPQEEKVKVNEGEVINHQPANDSPKTKKYNDNPIIPQPYCILNDEVDVTNPVHRAHQLDHNINIWKLSRFVVNTLFSVQPYPFSYIEPYNRAENNESGTTSLQSNAEGINNEPSLKSASFPPKNSVDESSSSEDGSFPVLGETPKKKIKYTIREDLDFLYQEWKRRDLFEVVKVALSEALAINSAFIVRKTSQGKEFFWNFNTTHIVKLVTKDRIPLRVKIKWGKLPSLVVEEVKDTKTGIPSLDELQESEEEYTIGKDCVHVCCDRHNPNTPLGRPYILQSWFSAVAKDFVRCLQLLFYYKGGLIGKYQHYPDTVDDTVVERFEKEMKKGLFSEGTLLPFPHGMNPDIIGKMFEHQETQGVNLDWAMIQSLFSQDQPYPKSLVEGQAESGALGGIAPEVDKQKEEEGIFQIWNFVEETVKLVNSAFFEIPDDYEVIPWYEDTPTMQAEPASMKAPSLAKKNTVKVGASGLFHKVNVKVNSATDIQAVFEGDLLAPTAFKQDDGSYEYLRAEDIRDYVEDPKSVKEFYFRHNHPMEDPRIIKKSEATGKARILEYDPEKGSAKGEVIFFENPTQDDLFLSPVFLSRDLTIDGKVYNTHIDLRNIVSADYPRAGRNIAIHRKKNVTRPSNPSDTKL